MKVAELQQPEVPKIVKYLWNWFSTLSAGRQSNGMAANPLSWQDIKAWADLYDNAPNSWELGTLRAIEKVFLND